MFYGLIGEKLSHSFSKTIHNLLGNENYELYAIPREHLADFLLKEDFGGLNVTIPYKKDVIPFCDELSPAAKQIGSVNTLVKRDGKLYGDNTDYYGFLYTAKRASIDFRGKKVAILGTGGTSLTAHAAAKDSGAREIITVSRRGDLNYENIYEHRDIDVIVNATPHGMYPNNNPVSLVDITRFPNLCGVIDVIFNPKRTALLLAAEEMQIPCAYGLPMLVAQAKRAAEIFFDKEIPDSEIERIYGILARKTENIVLIGMPGCGKSTIGKLLAKRLGMPFIDTDAEIEKAVRKPIPEIFSEQGEEGFRALESKIALDIGKATGAVIATGGGIVTREENYAPLKQNGTIVFLTCKTERLATGGRPLSKDLDTLRAMYETRLPLYKRFCDFTVENDRKPEDAVQKILAQLI